MRTTLKHGDRFTIALLVPTKIIASVDKRKKDLQDELIVDILRRFIAEYEIPDDAQIKWRGYKYCERINIYSIPIEFNGVIIEK